MSHFIEWTLIIWTAVAAVWWLVALTLVGQAAGVQKPEVEGPKSDVEKPEAANFFSSLTVFKPLPPLSAKIRHLAYGVRHPPAALVQALESFVLQLDQRCDLLMGIVEQDHLFWQPILDEWRAKYPRARFQTIVQPRPAQVANPKIAWQMRLSPLATGKLWLWSDADMVAPPGFLRAICAELQASGGKALTTPYVIRNIDRVEGVLDTLFVNVEFYPGTLLLRKCANTSVAFGAGTLFHAEEFQQKVDWQKLGSALADDYELGKLLGSVVLSQTTLETLPEQDSWGRSFRHFLRWHKTIRWCQPWGYAGQIVILPVLGWLIFALTHPRNPVGWCGLLVSCQIEACIALMICRRIGCRLPFRWLWAVEGWTVLRPVVWLASWLPLPVEWVGAPKKWRRPTQPQEQAVVGKL